MSLLDTAYQVLRDARQPLRPVEIIDRVLQRGLWRTSGLSPERTLHAQLAVDIKRHRNASRFQRTAPGEFALREWGLPDGTRPARQPRIRPRKEPRHPLSFTDAAEKILIECGDKKPMHYKAITEKALSEGLVSTTGQTPAATMYAQILTEIERKQRRGEQPRFVKYGKGLVGLSRWLGTGLAFQIEQYNSSIRKKLKAKLLDMDPGDFEEAVGELLGKMGFDEIDVTQRSGDGGIDVRGTLVVGDVIHTKMAVQVKRWRKNVQAPLVQQVRGALDAHEHGLIITTSTFSRGALEEAQRPNAPPVGLMDGDQLVALFVEYGIGVRHTTHDLIELGAEEEE